MKTFKTLVLVAVVSAFGLSNTFAQTNSATANASATIVQDLTIEKTNDLNFGVIIPSSTIATTFLLAPAGGVTVGTGTIDQILGDQTAASPEAAAFTVTGSGISIFTITLPTTINIESGANSMEVNNFLSSLPVAGVTLGGVLGDIDVTTSFTVGATLNVAAGQAAGQYTNTFDVVVNYL